MTAAALTAFRNRAQATMETLYPAVIRLGEVATDIPCSTGGLKRGNDLGSGGFTFDDQISFRILRTNLASLPAVGTKVTVTAPATLAGKTFRLDTLGNDPADPAVKLTCKALTS